MPPFQYRTYQDPYVGTVLDLMGAAGSERARAEEAIGNIRAQQALSKGQSMSQMVGGLANVASQAYGDYTTAQEDKIAQELLQQISDAPEMGVGPGYVSQGVPAGLDPPPLLEPRAGQDRYGGNFMDFTAAPATPSRRRAADILPPAFTADRPQAGARPAFTPPVPAGLTAPQFLQRAPGLDETGPGIVPGKRRSRGVTPFRDERIARMGLPPLNLGASDRALAPPTPYEGTLSAIAPEAEQGGRFGPLIEQYAAENNLSPELVGKVVKFESNFDPDARSPKGAVGLMQLMPGTARDLGVTDRRDPEQNIRGGTQYLRQMLDKFGDEDLALAAYNWGPGNVEEHLAAGKALADMSAGVRDYVANTRVGSAAATGLAQPPPVDRAQAETPRSVAERAPGLGATGPGLVPGPGLSQGVTPSEVSGPVVPPTGAPAGAPVGAPVGAPAGLRPSGQAPNVLGAMLSGQPVSGDLDDLSRQGRNLGVMARSKARRRYVHKTNDGRVDLGSMDQALAQRGVSSAGRRRILGELELRNTSISAFNQENRALALSEQQLANQASMQRTWDQALAEGKSYPDHGDFIRNLGVVEGPKLYNEFVEGLEAYENILKSRTERDEVAANIFNDNLDAFLTAIDMVPLEYQQEWIDTLVENGIKVGAFPAGAAGRITLGQLRSYRDAQNAEEYGGELATMRSGLRTLNTKRADAKRTYRIEKKIYDLVPRPPFDIKGGEPEARTELMRQLMEEGVSYNEAEDYLSGSAAPARPVPPMTEAEWNAQTLSHYNQMLQKTGRSPVQRLPANWNRGPNAAGRERPTPPAAPPAPNATLPLASYQIGDYHVTVQD